MAHISHLANNMLLEMSPFVVGDVSLLLADVAVSVTSNLVKCTFIYTPLGGFFINSFYFYQCVATHGGAW
jgi:hypothetical protein